MRLPRRRRNAAADTTPRGETLATSTGILVGSRLVMAAIGWAGSVLIVRSLSPADWGRFSFVFAFLYLISVVTELGVGRVAVGGMLDEERDRARFLGTYVVLRACLGVLGYALAIAVVAAAGYSSDVVAATAVAGLVMVVATPSNALDVAYQARSAFRLVATARVIGQGAQLALIVAIALHGGSLLLFVIPAVINEIVVAVIKVRRLPREIKPVYGVDLATWRAMMGEAAPLAVGYIVATALSRIDMVMLSKLDDFEAVGVYGIAYKFADLVQFVSTALATPAMPLLVTAWPDDPARYHDTIRRMVTIAALVGALVLAGFLLFARPAISLLYGERYAEGDTATQLVVAAEVVGLFGAIAFTALVSTGRRRLYPIATAVALALNVGLNFWLIPRWSYNGAAIATIAAETALAAILIVAALRLPVRPLPLGSLAGAASAGLAALAAGYAVDRIAPWPLAAVACVAVFVAAAVLLRAAGPAGFRALASRS
jgi:O-antigen/teichoic acid export membrane protein